MLEPRIMLVDDEPLWLRSLTRLLKTRRACVESFTSPPESLEALENGPWSLLVVDYQLGNGWTGARWAKAVRARLQETPPILLVSGALERVSIEERRYFDGVYPKTTPSQTLLDEFTMTLAEVSGRSRSQSRLRSLAGSPELRKRYDTPS